MNYLSTRYIRKSFNILIFLTLCLYLSFSVQASTPLTFYIMDLIYKLSEITSLQYLLSTLSVKHACAWILFSGINLCIISMLNKRRYKFTKQIAIAALLFSSSPLYAETQTIYGFSLEFRLTEGGSGQYNELLEEFKKEGLDFKLQIIPLKRAMRKFFRTNNESNCIFPTSLNAISKVEPNLDISSFLISEPADQISLRIFTRANSPVISDISELHGVKVALWNGLDPNLFLKGLDAKIENTPNELIRVKMLNANRIDAILGFTPDVILAAQKLNLPEPHFDGNLALFRDEGASLACKKSEKNIKFIDQYNVILKKLKANGRLNEILGPHIDLTP